MWQFLVLCLSTEGMDVILIIVLCPNRIATIVSVADLGGIHCNLSILYYIISATLMQVYFSLFGNNLDSLETILGKQLS